MKRARFLFAAVSMLTPIACADPGTGPNWQPDMPGGIVSVVTPLNQSVNLGYASIATGIDTGPQDGTFDSFTIPNLGSVNDNGWTSFRTAAEYSLSGVPAGATINSATLRVSIADWEGVRSVQVHGFSGDGTVSLADFARDRVLGGAVLQPVGGQVFTVDVTAFVAQLVASGAPFAGFSFREAPANTANFLVMFMSLTGNPALSVDFTAGPPVQHAEINIRPGSPLNVINLRSTERIPVAILSSAAFDAPREVDVTSLTFGRTGNEASLSVCSGREDINRDGSPDLVCLFNPAATGFSLGDVRGILRGKTRTGVAIEGADLVRIVI